MSNPADPWRALHAKRAKKIARRMSGTPSRVQAPAPIRPRTSREPVRIPPNRDPGPLQGAPAEPSMRFEDRPPPSRAPDPSSASKGRPRFLVSIDMVSDENREAVRSAARAEGRTLSQWARRVLLQQVTQP